MLDKYFMHIKKDFCHPEASIMQFDLHSVIDSKKLAYLSMKHETK